MSLGAIISFIVYFITYRITGKDKLSNWNRQIDVNIFSNRQTKSWTRKETYFLKGTAKRQNLSGFWLKPENLSSWTIYIRDLSDVPVSRNWYKTVSNYTKAHIYQIRNIKKTIINHYANNLKTTISQMRSLRNSDLLLL